VILTCALTAALTSCIRREGPHPSPADLRSSSAERGYIDLQAGWNVQVVFPKLRSGGYVLPSMQQESVGGSTIEMRTDQEFIGYEKDFYKVESQRDGGIEVRFSHAEVWEKGRMRRQSQPGLLLFPRNQDPRYIRLVYLETASAADHDMAIISAAHPEILDTSTQAVILHAECRPDGSATCIWVPKGVAVDPEK
jgi:hypothetical protein